MTWFDHRPREIRRTWLWAELEKIARFKRLENFSHYFQNDLAFLGRIGKPSFSEFPEIFGLTNGSKKMGRGNNVATPYADRGEGITSTHIRGITSTLC